MAYHFAHLPLDILDGFVGQFWKPKWKKEAQAILKGGQKFLNYKRDVLPEENIPQIQTKIDELKDLIRKRDKEALPEACKQLSNTCEHSLKSYRPPDALAENIEVFFVAIAVALGIRAYYVQPFRIPTGSMQPTLNGIIGHPQADPEWKKPNLLVQGFHKITEGRSYVKALAPRDTRIVNIQEKRHLWFFTRTEIIFSDGPPLKIAGSLRAILDGLQLGKALGLPSGTNEIGELQHQFPPRNRFGQPIRISIPVKKGQLLAQGWVDTGDLVLVDKFSYHFRQPARGEVYVFETRGIEDIQSEAHLKNQEAGSHYIKRLVGVPGDELRLEKPNLFHNGNIASEKGFKTVMSLENGYHGYFNPPPYSLEPVTKRKKPTFLAEATDTHTLSKGSHKDQYFAMGDNSANSSDSRYWGSIDEYLLVGPGLFTLWPFENFGFIR